MKMFALIMLRCAFIMLLSPLLQNGTLATLGEWEKSCQELEKWTVSRSVLVNTISFALGSITLDNLSRFPETKKSLDLLPDKVDKFPLKDEMKELLDWRLQKPLKLAKYIFNKLLNEVEHSGLEKDKKYLENLLFKIHSIAMGIDKEFNTFIFEVELELIKKVKWTSESKTELAKKFSNLCELSQKIPSYCNSESFSRALIWVSEIGGPPCQPGTPEFVEYLGILILNAKLGILKKELAAKIAVFAQQQPHIDGDGFMAFSHNFKFEWNKIKQQMDQVDNNDIASTMRLYRKELDDLAKTAMEETDPLKAIITEKLGKLITKCQNSSGKFNKEEASSQRVVTKGKGSSINPLKLILGSNKREQKKQKEQTKQKEEAKKKEINAKKEIISDIGMFDGAAYKLLVRFEHEELDNTFCAELETAVAEDKQMISNAYKIQQDNEL